MEFKNCPCMGINLDKLIQPATLALLATDSLHGYIIVQKLQETSMLRGKKPDPSGVYRCLKQMEQRSLVTAEWDVSNPGSARRLYTITDDGRKCFINWINALEDYQQSLATFLSSAKDIINNFGVQSKIS